MGVGLGEMGEYGVFYNRRLVLFSFLSAGKVASRTGKVVSATSQLEAILKRLTNV